MSDRLVHVYADYINSDYVSRTASNEEIAKISEILSRSLELLRKTTIFKEEFWQQEVEEFLNAPEVEDFLNEGKVEDE